MTTREPEPPSSGPTFLETTGFEPGQGIPELDDDPTEAIDGDGDAAGDRAGDDSGDGRDVYTNAAQVQLTGGSRSSPARHTQLANESRVWWSMLLVTATVLVVIAA